MKVELVYDMKCPKVVETRKNLIKAFTEAGIESNWIEWDRGSFSTPEDIKLYGSPAILVNGIDIDEFNPTATNENEDHRVYYNERGLPQGMPSVEIIVAALKADKKPDIKETDKKPWWNIW